VGVELLAVSTDLREFARMERELTREGRGIGDSVLTAAESACRTGGTHPRQCLAAAAAGDRGDREERGGR